MRLHSLQLIRLFGGASLGTWVDWVSLTALFLLLDEVVELLEIKESVTYTLLILVLIDKVMCVHSLVLQLLLLVLTHQLSQSAVELADILREQLAVTENLHQQLLLVFLPNESALDPESLICNLLPTIVEDFLGPNPSLLLLLVTLDLEVSFLKCKLSDFPIQIRIVGIVVKLGRIEKHLISLVRQHQFAVKIGLVIRIIEGQRKLLLGRTLSK
jgi:hypothetical protein